MRQQEQKGRYKKAANTAGPSFYPGKFAGALMRALAKFPEARQAVIAEFDRIGGVFA